MSSLFLLMASWRGVSPSESYTEHRVPQSFMLEGCGTSVKGVLVSEVYLEAGVAAEVEQRLHDLQVTLVDRDVQRRLSALVPGVEVGSSSVQNLDDGALVAKRGVMHRPVSVLILNEEKSTQTTYILTNKLVHFHLTVSSIMLTRRG